MFYIYAYENKINGKIYIGQTLNLINRNRSHCNKTMHIDNAIKKYGRNNFDLWTIKMVDTIDEANQEEIFWIAEMKNQLGNNMVYNKSNGGYGIGMHSEENKSKMRQPKSKEHKTKLSEANKGKKLTEDHKKKISIVRIGKKFSIESKQKMSNSHIGKTKSEETKAKMSEAKRKMYSEKRNTNV